MLLLQKEFLAALCMSALTVLFATGLGELYGEARTIPQILVLVMAFINVAQYIIAFWHGRKGASVLPLLKSYPFALVGRLILLTIAYVCSLFSLGFYVGSFLFLFFGAMLADPEPGKYKRIIVQGLSSGLFILGLYALFSVALGVQIPTGSLWH